MKRFCSLMLVLVSGCLMLQGSRSWAQNKNNPKVDQKRIDEAIDRGTAFLKNRVVVKNQFSHTDNLGNKRMFDTDELLLLTLVHSSLPADDASLQKQLEVCLAKKMETTYTVVLLAMSLATLDKKAYQDRIAACGQYLIDTQCLNGQWGYGGPIPDPGGLDTGKKPVSDSNKGGKKTEVMPDIKLKKRQDGPARGDNSNTQYAALGIRACLESGVVIPKDVLLKAKTWWETSQFPDGGWGYDGDAQKTEQSGYLAMTAGGMASVSIYRFFLKEDYKKAPSLANAARWLATHFSVTENVGYPPPSRYTMYTLYAIERAGILSENEKFGDHEWYVEGVDQLLSTQAADGSWTRINAVMDTCFAILFLKRSTKPLKYIDTGKKR